MRFYTVILVWLLSVFAAPVWAQPASHLRATLLSQTSAIIPGKPVTLGVHFTVHTGWHIYWQNPGDAGLATSITWKLPRGFKAGKILWPIPQVISYPSITDFGYEKEVLLMVPISTPQNLKPGDRLNFSAQIHWLVCNQICIPGEATLHLKIPVAAPSQERTINNPLFSAERRKLPIPLPRDWRATGTLNPHEFRLTFTTHKAFEKAFFFPFLPDEIDNSANQIVQKTGSRFTLMIQRSDQLLQDVQKISGLLVLDHLGHQTGYETTIPLSNSR